MAASVGIVGASGYGGAELLRLLEGHPAIDATVVAAASQAGEPVADLYPNLADERRFVPVDVDALAGLDLVFLATPQGPSLELAPQLLARDTTVVDLSDAFRLPADRFGEVHGAPHPHPGLLDEAVYGLTELHRAAIRDARLVANPGCYPTTAQLGLVPLAGLVEPGSVRVSALSGLSGAGRAARPHLHFAHAHDDLVAYGAPTHRHTQEIEHGTMLATGIDLGAITFVPHLVPIARGMHVSTTALLRDGVDAAAVQAALEDAWADEPFVRVLPPGGFPHSKAVAGSNGVQVGAVVDERTGTVVVSSVSDNLGKGAAGQALQNANLLLGLDEGLGLTATGVYP